MLLKTGVSLQKMPDLQVLDIMERQKKGGLTFVGAQRHVVANNKYTRHFKTTGKWLNQYNEAHPEKPINIDDDVRPDDNYIVYLDANNLYGWAMSQSLPYDEVKSNTEVPEIPAIEPTAKPSVIEKAPEVPSFEPQKISELQ
jgi:hypothetical protein